MGASDEAHEWAKTWGGQRSGEVKAGYVGFEVVIENGGTAHHLEFCAQGRAEVGKPAEVKTEPSGGNDVISTLGNLACGRAQAELDAVADRGSLEDWWPNNIGTLPSTRSRSHQAPAGPRKPKLFSNRVDFGRCLKTSGKRS